MPPLIPHRLLHPCASIVNITNKPKETAMDFTWAMKALKEGKKVTRKSLAGDPPIYLYLNKTDATIMRDYGARTDSKWYPSLDDLLAEDWEEYVDPVKDQPELDAETIRALEQLAKIMTDAFVACFREDGIRRLLQKKLREG